jgi:hypothetical protein
VVSSTATGAATGPSSDPTRAFRERARLEADRYGPDPWIFVRELLQNSRDAGATRVQLVVETAGDIERVTCIDDGDGMTFDHARRYLFSLYASSKEGAKNQAGRFGVGFWSVLRFDPSSIVIRSFPRGGAPWGLQLDGTLANAAHADPSTSPGTVVMLERPRGDGRLEHRVFDAVWQSGRYLHHRDDLDKPVTITVNGRVANAEFALGAPSTSFRKRDLRGVVGLGPSPRVELFCRGLRVRAAASLEDLVAPAGRHTSRMRVLFPELPGGLAPQALLESESLELLLSRSDARDNRALQKLVRLAQRELERLVERQLAHARPRAWFVRIFDALRGLLGRSVLVRSLVGATIGGALALGLSHFLWGLPWDSPTLATEPVVVRGDGAGEVVVGAPPSGLRAYRDLGARYRGPKVDVLTPASAEPIAMTYEPPDARLYLAALAFSELTPDGSPIHEEDPIGIGEYTGTFCGEGCVEISVPFETDGAASRVPLPTGHRVVADSATMDGKPIVLQAAFDGMPLVPGGAPLRGLLRYRTAPAPDPGTRRITPQPVALPGDFARLATRLRALPIDDRISLSIAHVRRAVRYDHSEEVSAEHAEAAGRGGGFIARTLEIGAGDCDVQNALLTALLQAADVRAKMAVGFIGSRGRTMPWLHAWVEYLGEDGVWRIADASDRIASSPVVVASADGGSPTRVPADDGGVRDPADDDGGEPIAVPEPAASGGNPEPDQAPTAAPVVVAPPIPAPPTPAPPTPAPPTAAAPTITSASPPVAESSWLARVAAFDRRFPWLLRAIPALLLAFAAWLVFGGRMRRATTLDDSADLSRLLQGVLQQPGAFGHVAALFHRPLVPLSDGRAISLHRARELAASGRLYRTRTRAALAARAIRSGAAVLDDCTPEGATVADALGAVDVDRWSAMLERSTSDRTLVAVNAALRERGEDWCIRVATDVAGGMAVLDLAPLGARLPGVQATRLVLFDVGDAVLQRATMLAKQSPRAAVLLALDHVAGRLGIAEDRRGHLLAGAARSAVLETFGR